MSRTTVALNWTCGSRLQMAAQVWVLSGQVCFTQFGDEKYLKPIYTGVTVFPGKNVLQFTETRIHSFNLTRLDWFHPNISE
jgi:hypothetical protein